MYFFVIIGIKADPSGASLCVLWSDRGFVSRGQGSKAGNMPLNNILAVNGLFLTGI